MVKYKRPIKYINGKQKLLSRIVMENKLKRKLKSDELINHIDGDPYNNNVNNLLLTNRSEHKKIHDNIGKKTRFKQKYVFNEKEIKHMYESGLNTYKISLKYGCHAITIERYLKCIYNTTSLRKVNKLGILKRG